MLLNAQTTGLLTLAVPIPLLLSHSDSVMSSDPYGHWPNHSATMTDSWWPGGTSSSADYTSHLGKRTAEGSVTFAISHEPVAG